MAADGVNPFTAADASDPGWPAHGSSTALRPPPSEPDRVGHSVDNVGPVADLGGADHHRADAGDIDRSGASGDARHRLRRRWRLVTVYIVVVALLVVAVAVGVAANRQLGRTDDSLNAIRDQLRQTTTRVAAARAKLAAVTGETAAAGRTLETETSQLASDQAELAKAQSGVQAKGVSISELDTCLSGVEQALNQIAVGDQAGAAKTLDGVSGNCRDAEPPG